MYRKILKLSFIALIILGVIFSLVPFMSSLQPNSDSLNKAPHVNLAHIQVGQSVTLDLPRYKVWIFKHNSNQINAFAIPFRNNHYQLPEFTWQRPRLPCQSFIQEHGFQCLDAHSEVPVWFSYMKWNKQGKFIGEQKWNKVIPDLMVPKYKIVAQQFIFLGL